MRYFLMVYAVGLGMVSYANATPHKMISFTQHLSVQLEREVYQERYSAEFLKQYRIIVWHRLKQEHMEDTRVWGGGIETPFVVAGHVLSYGAYTYFGDMSYNVAWNTAPYQYTNWKIRRYAVENPMVGVLLHIPYKSDSHGDIYDYFRRPLLGNPLLSLWFISNPIEDSSSQEQRYIMPYISSDYRVGFSLGHVFENAIISWEPKVLYQYSWRNGFPFEHTDWSTWTITLPTALRMHQIILHNNLIFFQDIFWELVGKVVVTDTMPSQFVGKTLLGINIENITLSFCAVLSQRDAIYEDWKYSKYLWNTSGELQWKYYKTNIIQVRFEVAEYNNRTKHIMYPRSMREQYSIKWKHNFSLMPHSMSLQPNAQISYARSEYDEYIKSLAGFVYSLYQWRISINTSWYWNINNTDLMLESVEINTGAKIKYTFTQFPVSLWFQEQWEYDKDMHDNLLLGIDDIQRNTKEFTNSIGVQCKYNDISIYTTFIYTIKNKYFSNIGYQYEHEWNWKLSIQYMW